MSYFFLSLLLFQFQIPFFLHVPLIFIIMTTVTHINAALCAYKSLLGWIYGVKLVLFQQ